MIERKQRGLQGFSFGLEDEADAIDGEWVYYGKLGEEDEGQSINLLVKIKGVYREVDYEDRWHCCEWSSGAIDGNCFWISWWRK